MTIYRTGRRAKEGATSPSNNRRGGRMGSGENPK